jgi:hypothetical protein
MKKIYSKTYWTKMKWILSLIIFLFTFSYSNGQEFEFGQVKVSLLNDTLTLENKFLKHTYLWNSGHLKLLSLVEKLSGKSFITGNDINDLVLAGEKEFGFDSIAIKREDPYALGGDYVKVECYSVLGKVFLKREILIYPESPALRHIFYFKGEANVKNWELDTKEVEVEMVETNALDQTNPSRMAAIHTGSPHWKYKIISFREATDYHDSPVSISLNFPFRQSQEKVGNILIGESIEKDLSLFIIKESPIEKSQSIYPGFDFRFNNEMVSVHGLGISPPDLEKNEWKRAYGFAIGLSSLEEWEQKAAMLTYQKQIRKFIPQRDGMFLSNTWGDRSRDSRMNEEFIINELKIASRLGITHLQLDDGWQKGLSANSSNKEGKIWDDWKAADWTPHPDRFPNGFSPIIKIADSLKVEICLWFNPSKSNDYVNWERDADILIGYYRDFGIRVFKIDGLFINSKTSEDNLRKMFEKVMAATSGTAVFNFDVTAGRRGGYHFFQEYGNIFLENRYTDWGNYFPYRTLSNVWELGSFVPLDRIQVEFLNVGRNQDKYHHKDKLSPFQSGQKYATAIGLLGQPLSWMELSNLKEGENAVSEVLNGIKDIKNVLDRSIIIPIGKGPNGFGSADFFVISELGKKYLFHFREAIIGPPAPIIIKLPITIKSANLIWGDQPEELEVDRRNNIIKINYASGNKVSLIEID